MTVDWFQTLLNSLVSGLVVGLVVAVAKIKLERAGDALEEANRLRVKNLEHDILACKEEVMSAKQIIGKIQDAVNETAIKISTLTVEQRHLAEKVSEIGKQGKTQLERFGSVIRKDRG